jgi:alpha-glucosidase (family GH31 glycosyl hydrolase)
MITLSLSPTQGVRNRGPNFELFPDGAPTAPPVSIINPNPSSTILADPPGKPVTFKAGSMAVEIGTASRKYSLAFTLDGKPLTGTEPKGQAVIDVPRKYTLAQASETSIMAGHPDAEQGVSIDEIGTSERVRFMLNELVLGVGETIYGLGERFGAFVKNGQKVSIWNQGACCSARD